MTEQTGTIEADMAAFGMTMPPDFPRATYLKIELHCRPRIPPDGPLKPGWDQYAFAWNAIRYRFRAMADHDDLFRASIGAAGHELRYVQERELFEFFASGFSCLETCAYGLCFLGSIDNAATFDTRKPRDVTLTTFTSTLEKLHPTLPLTQRLIGLRTDPAFSDWKECRHVLTHRGAPGRIIEASVGGPPRPPDDDIWKLREIPLNDRTTLSRRQWLAATLDSVLRDAEPFVASVIH